MVEPFSNLLKSKEAVSENVRMLTQKVVEKIGHNTYIKTKLDSYENRYILKTNLSKFMIFKLPASFGFVDYIIHQDDPQVKTNV